MRKNIKMNGKWTRGENASLHCSYRSVWGSTKRFSMVFPFCKFSLKVFNRYHFETCPSVHMFQDLMESFFSLLFYLSFSYYLFERSRENLILDFLLPLIWILVLAFCIIGTNYQNSKHVKKTDWITKIYSFVWKKIQKRAEGSDKNRRVNIFQFF